MTLDPSMKLLPHLRAALCALGLALAGAGLAQPQSRPAAPDSEARFVAALEQASHEQLKSIYLACSDEAERRVLGSGEAAACSIAYETLKRRVFGGDFDALLAWSRSQAAARTGAPEVAGAK